MQNSWFPAVPKPIIGAINGACAGLGMVMALYTDIRFASDAAVFTTAFSRRGLIAEHGISHTLPRLVGLSKALDLLVSARKFDADEALRKDALTKAILPSFAKRCGPDCVKTWNDTVGKTLNVTLAP